MHAFCLFTIAYLQAYLKPIPLNMIRYFSLKIKSD